MQSVGSSRHVWVQTPGLIGGCQGLLQFINQLPTLVRVEWISSAVFEFHCGHLVARLQNINSFDADGVHPGPRAKSRDRF